MEKYKKLNTGMFGEFDAKNKNYKDGVFALRLTLWSEFHDVVKKFNNYPDYFWRGQKEDWQLKSSFDRSSSMQRSSYLFNRPAVLDKLLEKFKKKIHDLPVSIPDDNDKIWGIGQHYGLPTPLLDWTIDPYIAAYFAFYQREISKGYRIVYALNRAVKRLLLKKKNPRTKETISRDRFLEFLDLTESSDKIQNKRLKEQKGRFTKSLNGIDIESNVLKNYTRKSPDINLNEDILLMKIFIPDTLSEECLKYLESVDITHGALFPDYSGAAEICKIDLGIDNKK